MKHDDDITPPPTPIPQPAKSDTEYNLHVPFDPQWFHEWRRELRRDMRDIKGDLEAQKIAATRLDQRLDGITERIGRVEKHVQSVDVRVLVLEGDTLVNAGVESKIRKIDKQSWATKVKDGAAGQVGAAIVLGIAAVLVWLLTQYFKAQT